MVQGRHGRPRRRRSTVTIALTTAGCPLRAQIQQRHPRAGRLAARASTEVAHRLDRDDRRTRRPRPWRKARWNISAARRGHVGRPPTTRVVTIASGKGGVGKSSVTVNLAAALAAAGLEGRRARRRHLGLLGAAHARRRRPAARATVATSRKIDGPERARDRRRACVRVVSMGFLVEDEETALMWRGLMLNRGVQHFLAGRRLGRRPRLPAHRHAARHRRRADGRGQAAAPRRGDHRHHAGASRPRRSRSAPSTWPARATCASPASSRT